MCVLNRIDRLHLALAALQSASRLAGRVEHAETALRKALAAQHEHVRRIADDLSEARDWVWPERSVPEVASEASDSRRALSDFQSVRF